MTLLPPPLISVPSSERTRYGCTAECPHPAPFVCRVRVSAAQLSSVVPHVSNVEYVRWLDRAAEMHSDECGMTREQLREAGLMWFVARHEIDYRAETWMEDDLAIITWVRHTRRVKAWREFIIHRPSDDTMVCRASTLWVLVNLETRRPSRIPPKILDDFHPLERRS